jgi:beta-glucosidase
MVRAHAAAYHAIHQIQPKARVGLAKHMVVWRPRRFWLPPDQLVSRWVNQISNHVILDGVTHGVMSLPLAGSFEIPQAKDTLDWLGLNYYQRFRVGIKIRDTIRSLPLDFNTDLLHLGTRPGLQKGPGEWGEIHPAGLLESLQSIERYGVPIYITENGIPDADDRNRPAFILTHLHQLWRALRSGLDVRGYYHWSLVDNFEWSEGYDPRFRFGLYSVDFETQQRTLKESGRLYGQICRAGGITGEMVDEFAPQLRARLFPASTTS